MFLINHFSFTALFWACLGLSLVSLLITHRLKRRQIDLLPDSTPGDSFLLSRKALPPSIISSFSLFMWGVLTAFFPLYAVDQGVSNPGLFFTTMVIMLILGRAFGGKLYWISIAEKKLFCLALPLISFRWSSSLFPKYCPCLFLLR